MKNQRAILFLGVAALCGVLAVFLTRSWLHAQMPGEIAGVQTIPVVVAAVGLPAGVELAARQVDVVDWPKDNLPPGTLNAPHAVNSRVLRRALIEGEPVLESALLPVGSDAGLTPLISENHRAMSVKVDAVVGVAGFIKPGSHVDVLATVRRVDFHKPVPESHIILQDLRVLAIDQTLEKADRGKAEIVSVVTLEVDPNESQKLAYAVANGTLQLALRNPADDASVRTNSVTVRDLVNRGTRRSGNSVETVRGSSRSKDSL